MAATFGPELVPLFDRIIAVLDECEAVTQQQIIELLAARHALRTVEHADSTAEGMHQHIKQLIQQLR